MAISRHRTRNVVDYLAEHFGIARARLAAEGFGESRRVAYGTRPEGRQENRRVSHDDRPNRCPGDSGCGNV